MTNNKRLYSLTQIYEMEKADESFILTVINIFLEFVPANANELVASCAKKDWDAVYFIAHKMKANVNLLDIEIIKEDIRLIEHSSKTRTGLNQLTDKVKLVNNAIQQAAREMKEDFNL